MFSGDGERVNWEQMQRFERISSTHFQAFTMKKNKVKVLQYANQIHGNDNAPSHEQEVSDIITNSGVHKLIDDKIIKSPFNKNSVATFH